MPVDGSELTVRWAGNVVARHHLAAPGADVWDPSHRATAEASALASNQRRHLRVVETTGELPAAPAGRIDLGAGDYDIAAPDLTLYQGGEAGS